MTDLFDFIMQTNDFQDRFLRKRVSANFYELRLNFYSLHSGKTSELSLVPHITNFSIKLKASVFPKNISHKRKLYQSLAIVR